MTTDGCLQRSGSKTASVQEQIDTIVADLASTPSQEKTAGAVVYLMEELGDARLRCEELIRYTAAATQLIEKSAHRDHFFEIAGNLIEGIPKAVFKLHKALQAVALAATRIDYEELKQDLRPEKVTQLEDALRDVRIRQVQRRSDPVTQWEQKMIDDWKTAEARSAKTEEKESRYEEGKPADPTENMSPEDAKTWKLEHLKNKDNFKAASSEEKESRYEEGKPADPTENMSPEDAKTWKLEHLKNKDNFKEAKRDTHLEGKKGHTLCGERAYDDTLVESVKDASCHYCKQGWEKQHKSAALDWKAPDAR